MKGSTAQSAPTHASCFPLFGPAGLADSFRAEGGKHSWQAPAYLARFGLTALEYQAGHGVRISEEVFGRLRQTAGQYGIALSLHAPYYISMSGADDEKRLNSLEYLRQSAQAVTMLGGTRIVFHCGNVAAGQPRAEALARAQDTLARARQLLDDEGYTGVHLCPETMGKHGQLGDLDEVLALCRADKRHIPCIDFGHLNARSGGGMQTRKDFEGVALAIGEALGEARYRRFHVHFSKIAYGDKGEKHHLTFEDREYGPPYEPFVELCADWGLCPVVICESRGTQTEDAAAMRSYYIEYKTQKPIQKEDG